MQRVLEGEPLFQERLIEFEDGLVRFHLTGPFSELGLSTFYTAEWLGKGYLGWPVAVPEGVCLCGCY